MSSRLRARVDDDRLTRLAIADEVNEVDQLDGEGIAGGEVTSDSSWGK